MTSLIPILGDQLSLGISSLADVDPRDCVLLMMEAGEEALAAQQAFLDEALRSFGDYQDAMVSGQPLLWHAHLSPYINSGLLDPLERMPARSTRFIGISGRAIAKRSAPIRGCAISIAPGTGSARRPSSRPWRRLPVFSRRLRRGIDAALSARDRFGGAGDLLTKLTKRVKGAAHG